MTSRFNLWKKTWPLVVAPILFLILHAAFSQARGPFFLGFNYDPDYAYLFNGLNLTSGIPPDHIDHPGTSLQLFAAAGIKLANFTATKVGTNETVLAHSEMYLGRLNLTLMIGYAISMVLFAAWVWRKTGSMTVALLWQAAPFLLDESFLEVTRFRPESMILIIAGAMAAVLYVRAFQDEPDGMGVICLLAFLAVTGVVTKINFLPFVLVPLFCLRTWKARAIYLVLLCCFGSLWMLPLKPHYQRFATWVLNLVTREGRYGDGAPGLIGQHYSMFLAQLVPARPALFLAIALGFTALIQSWRRPKRTARETRLAWLLAGLVLAQIVECLMVGKFGHARYLLPAMAFLGLNAAVLAALARCWQDGPPRLPWILPVGACLSILVAGWSGFKLHHLHTQMARDRDAHAEIARALDKDFSDKTVVYYYGCSSLYHALWFGNAYSGRRHGKIIIDQLFPRHGPAYVAEEWPNQTIWYSVAGPDDKIEERLQRGETLFLAGQKWPEGRERELFIFLPKNAALVIDRILEKGDGAVYRVKLSPPDPR